MKRRMPQKNRYTKKAEDFRKAYRANNNRSNIVRRGKPEPRRPKRMVPVDRRQITGGSVMPNPSSIVMGLGRILVSRGSPVTGPGRGARVSEAAARGIAPVKSRRTKPPQKRRARRTGGNARYR